MWNWIARLLTGSRRENEPPADAPASVERAPAARPPPATPPPPAAPPHPPAGELRHDWQSWLAAAMRSTAAAPIAPDVVADALDALPPFRLLAVDEALRKGSWRDYFHTRGARNSALHVPRGAPVEVAAFLFAHACASSGYARERALALLPDHPSRITLAAALIRADDWVPAVRSCAERALGLLLPACGDDVFALLPLVESLRRRERFAQTAWPTVVEPVLLEPRHAASRWLATHSTDRKTRAAAYALVVKAEPERRLEACRQASVDADPSIVRWALGTAGADAGIDLFLLGLRHRSGSIRAESLRRLVAADVADLRERLERALFDESGAARDVAVYWLRERYGVDARTAWRHALDTNENPAARIALQALGERAEAIDAERVRPFLHDPVARARIAALKALANAQPDDIDSVLADALCDPSRRVVATALERLRHRPGGLDTEALRAAFATNPRAR